MRNITILIVMATTAALAYKFMQEDTASEQPQVVISQTNATFGLEDRLDKLASVLQRYQQTNQEQLRQAKLQQDRMNRMLANLDTRLQSVETTDGKQTTDTDISDSDTEKLKASRISENDYSHWMDATLDVGNLDKESTKLATAQTEKRLEKVPSIDLEDMQCGEGFCRATFVHENGKQPDIADLFGEPPFLNEGFTVHEADGRICSISIGPVSP